ncbi:UDP-3-O-(3-hydroxymyristoyl)glucosamine N-acyltransferase [Terriglobus saanensis]|uniref:UDP-3-O-(3-hydroxymyristoyl) glucosamine N-acyltransferase n=1 Tax=Terriglobus saanensis (strain ATCC BAA-1853 / DSM 23119 / SP1PR4) TaxID=401053 RepID=E8UZC3_TERSS|nr:UDP-3-O-(3-hydroxymyristoyl)glucosamine N-acyltransferase [Terriglobus saanensis]ADV82141.1 UDP-3-O-(3-hydroxymyristoyl) glucosamine N-acyltransferase [Terriglobus saanensis SP1PR4]
MPNLRQIAEMLHADAEDFPEGGEIMGVASIEGALPSDAVFASDATALERATISAAGCILARLADAFLTEDPRVIPVKDPRFAFSVLAQKLSPAPQGHLHTTAVLGTNVSLGENVSIGAGTVIGDNVTIGDNTTIDARVVVYAGVEIGARVLIQSGAVVGSMGFGYACSASGEYIRFPQQGRLVIEDDVEIGANSTIDRGALEETRIGCGSKLDNLVHIGHNCILGKNVIIAAQTGISGSSVVEDGAILGGQVGIGEHATVGDHVILGGGAGVLSGKKLRGPNQIFWGRPAQPLKQYLRDLAKLRKL